MNPARHGVGAGLAHPPCRAARLGWLLVALMAGRPESANAGYALDFLEGFNYVITWKGGQIVRIAVSGRNGSGRSLFSLDPDTLRPASLRNLPAGSVSRLSGINPSGFRQMVLGERTTLKFPTGEAVFIHDNRYEHRNGDFTWIGRHSENADLRAFFTFGRDGAVVGAINGPDGHYRIETVAGEVWLIDLAMAGLQPLSLADDVQAPEAAATARRTAPVEPALDSGTTTVDLLVLYSRRLNNPVTRINSLVAIANQAYIDSAIALKLRLVGTEVVAYGDSTRNTAALKKLTNSRGLLRRTAALRDGYGADLVTLLRPFVRTPQKNCGVAWVNGARRTGLQAKYAFSVVSDGRDRQGAPYYCDDLTLVHELGHNFGSVHDRKHASTAGVFPYSHGYRLPRNAGGTIMSYYLPRLAYFSNPRIYCGGDVCGNARYADNARSITNTAPIVARFRRERVP